MLHAPSLWLLYSPYNKALYLHLWRCHKRKASGDINQLGWVGYYHHSFLNSRCHNPGSKSEQTALIPQQIRSRKPINECVNLHNRCECQVDHCWERACMPGIPAQKSKLKQSKHFSFFKGYKFNSPGLDVWLLKKIIFHCTSHSFTLYWTWPNLPLCIRSEEVIWNRRVK